MPHDELSLENLVRVPFDGLSDFQAMTLAPGLPMLDSGKLTYQVLLGWFGELLAEPEVDEHGVTFHVQSGGRRQTITERALTTEADLEGPLQADFEKLKSILLEVQPESPSERLIFERMQPPEGNKSGTLFRVRTGDGRDRLVWCWGFQRRTQYGTAKLCPNPACSRLSLHNEVAEEVCPHCGEPFAGSQQTSESSGSKVPKTAVAAGVVLTILAGGTIWLGSVLAEPEATPAAGIADAAVRSGEAAKPEGLKDSGDSESTNEDASNTSDETDRDAAGSVRIAQEPTSLTQDSASEAGSASGPDVASDAESLSEGGRNVIAELPGDGSATAGPGASTGPRSSTARSSAPDLFAGINDRPGSRLPVGKGEAKASGQAPANETDADSDSAAGSYSTTGSDGTSDSPATSDSGGTTDSDGMAIPDKSAGSPGSDGIPSQGGSLPSVVSSPEISEQEEFSEEQSQRVERPQVAEPPLLSESDAKLDTESAPESDPEPGVESTSKSDSVSPELSESTELSESPERPESTELSDRPQSNGTTAADRPDIFPQTTVAETDSPKDSQPAEATAFTWHDDYLSAYVDASGKKQRLLMLFHDSGNASSSVREERFDGNDSDGRSLFAPNLQPDLHPILEQYSRVRLPMDAAMPSEEADGAGGVSGTPERLLAHRSFRHLHKQPGLAIVDLTNPRSPNYARVVSALPLPETGRFTQSSLQTLLQLPSGSISQRTLLFAIRSRVPDTSLTMRRFLPLLSELTTRDARYMAQLEQAGVFEADDHRERIIAEFGTDAEFSRLVFATDSSTTIQDAAFQAVEFWKSDTDSLAALMAPAEATGMDLFQSSETGRWYASCLVVR